MQPRRYGMDLEGRGRPVGGALGGGGRCARPCTVRPPTSVLVTQQAQHDIPHKASSSRAPHAEAYSHCTTVCLQGASMATQMAAGAATSHPYKASKPSLPQAPPTQSLKALLPHAPHADAHNAPSRGKPGKGDADSRSSRSARPASASRGRLHNRPSTTPSLLASVGQTVWGRCETKSVACACLAFQLLPSGLCFKAEASSLSSSCCRDSLNKCSHPHFPHIHTSAVHPRRRRVWLWDQR